MGRGNTIVTEHHLQRITIEATLSTPVRALEFVRSDVHSTLIREKASSANLNLNSSRVNVFRKQQMLSLYLLTVTAP